MISKQKVKLKLTTRYLRLFSYISCANLTAPSQSQNYVYYAACMSIDPEFIELTAELTADVFRLFFFSKYGKTHNTKKQKRYSNDIRCQVVSVSNCLTKHRPFVPNSLATERVLYPRHHRAYASIRYTPINHPIVQEFNEQWHKTQVIL